MAFPSRWKTLLFAPLLLGLLSCAGTGLQGTPREKRPVAGDTVTPVILLGKTWKQKGLVLLSARVQVQGKADAEPTLLQLEDVPYEIVPRVNLTFFDGEKELERMEDVPLTRDC